MGTFHNGKGELHGITVVVDTLGPAVMVGRCHEMDKGRIVLLDADVHEDGDEGRSKEEYLRQAARFGIWPKHPRLELALDQVLSIRRLGEICMG